MILFVEMQEKCTKTASIISFSNNNFSFFSNSSI